jgi:FAD/FMN-containing dehydrogenase
MTLPLVAVFATTAVLILASILTRLFSQCSQSPPAPAATPSPPEAIRLVNALAAALPSSVLLPDNAAAFAKSKDAYWAAQECEVVPGCVVQPRDAQELGRAVAILQQEHKSRWLAGAAGPEGLFAVRSGGHSAIPGAATIKGGALIDLSLLCEVTPSDDGTSVTIGAGAKWKHVSQVLDERGLGVVGGRNSDVGVGGLTLGGKFSNLTYF